MSLVKRITYGDRADAARQLREIVQQKYETGAIQGYGRGLLHSHFRSQGYVASRSVWYFENIVRLQKQHEAKQAKFLSVLGTSLFCIKEYRFAKSTSPYQ